MGLIEWILGKRPPSYVTHRVWLTQRAKQNGIADAIADVLNDHTKREMLFLVGYFSDCVEKLHTLVADRQLNSERIVVASVSDLDPLVNTRECAMNGLCIFVGEAHPLPIYDEPLTEIAHRFPDHCRIIFNISLDDAIMMAYAGERTQETLKRLGMGENEAIESRMISRRIESARSKIAARAFGDAPASSADEWFLLNFPLS
jgi:hypothetical protein